MPVIRYQKTLEREPVVAPAANVRLRTFGRPHDATAWLLLRQGALADQIACGRAWQLADFRRELLDKPWFVPGHFWLAEPMNGLPPRQLAGSIALQLDDSNTAVVHWLLVAPEYRRRKIATNLLQLAESTAWQQQRFRLRLETLSTWQAACRFYHALGYEEA